MPPQYPPTTMEQRWKVTSSPDHKGMWCFIQDGVVYPGGGNPFDCLRWLERNPEGPKKNYFNSSEWWTRLSPPGTVESEWLAQNDTRYMAR